MVRWQATARFPAEGIDEDSDRVHNKIRSGLVNGVSIGFRPLDYAPSRNGSGYTFEKSELLEFSFVSVPAHPDALIIERSARARRQAVRERQRRAARVIEEAAYSMIASADPSEPRELLDAFALLERAREML